MPHLFTPDEANAALVDVRPLAELLVERSRELAAAQARQAELGEHIAGNGGDLVPADVRDVATNVERAVGAVVETLAELEALGVQVKDAGAGLVDFPARRHGDDVLLCWKVGEPKVAFWHGAEEGFAGRKPLPFDDPAPERDVSSPSN